MKYALIFFISFSAAAEVYEVTTSAGHVYTYTDEGKKVSLKSNHVSFEMDRKSCSEMLLNDLKTYFNKQLRLRTTGTTNVIEVKVNGIPNGVPAGSKHGRKLIQFPDHFAKTYLTYKELCK